MGDMIVVGGDWNAQIRREAAPEAVGSWACKTTDAPGRRLGRFLQQHDLYLPTSWCQTQWRNRYTWSRGNSRSLLDWIALSTDGTKLHPRPLRDSVCDLGSDHRAVGVELTLPPHYLQIKRKDGHCQEQKAPLAPADFGVALQRLIQRSEPKDWEEVQDACNEALEGMEKAQHHRVPVGKAKELVEQRNSMPRSADPRPRRKIGLDIKRAILRQARAVQTSKIREALEKGSSWRTVVSNSRRRRIAPIAAYNKDGALLTSDAENMQHIADYVAGIYARPTEPAVIPAWPVCVFSTLQNLQSAFAGAAKSLSKGAKPDHTGLSNKCLSSMTEGTTELLSRLAAQPNKQPEVWKKATGCLLFKKGDKQEISNYRLLSIAPMLARYTSAAFGKQILPILDEFYGNHQHGFRAGRSTTSLLQIIENATMNALTEGTNLIVIQLDISKAFDRLHRGALMSFTEHVIRPAAPEAAAFIVNMYDGDTVTLTHQSETATVNLEAGIRQGDPLSPKLFAAMIGHAVAPAMKKWKQKGWGYKGVTKEGETVLVPMLAYADDITLLCATTGQA